MDDRRYIEIDAVVCDGYDEFRVWSWPWGDQIGSTTIDRNDAFRAALKHAAKYVGFAECRRILDAWERGTGGLKAPEPTDA